MTVWRVESQGYLVPPATPHPLGQNAQAKTSEVDRCHLNATSRQATMLQADRLEADEC